MDRGAAQAVPTEELLFRDGFGDRLLIRDGNGLPSQESLVLRTELSGVPSFEFALNQRIAALESFEDASFVHVRRIVRLPGRLPRLSVVSDYSNGTRVSELLSTVEQKRIRLTPAAPAFIIRGVLEAIITLHRHNTEISHGAIGPERTMLANGRVRVNDYALGSAVEQLRFPAERYWKELRVAVPSAAGALRFDKRIDIAQIGMFALALFASRPLRDNETMGNIAAVLAGLPSLPAAVRTWLFRALYMDPRRTFSTVVEAQQGFEEAIAEVGIQPSCREFDSLAVRLTPAAPARSEAKPVVAMPQIALPKPAPALQKKQTEWQPHDVEPGQMYEGPPPATLARGPIPQRTRSLLKMLLLTGFLGLAFSASRFLPAPSFLFTPTGTIQIDSKPQGVTVSIDGQPQGVTPLLMKVNNGRHAVEVRSGSEVHMFNLWVSSGSRVAQIVEFRNAPHGRVVKTEPEPEEEPVTQKMLPAMAPPSSQPPPHLLQPAKAADALQPAADVAPQPDARAPQDARPPDSQAQLPQQP